jgi:hypothetical protein
MASRMHTRVNAARAGGHSTRTFAARARVESEKDARQLGAARPISPATPSTSPRRRVKVMSLADARLSECSMLRDAAHLGVLVRVGKNAGCAPDHERDEPPLS